MDNEYADTSGNQINAGEPQDSTVGHDETGTQQESSSPNFEEQAKYFQSEKDKLYAENQKLEQYAKVGKFLESRPDLVEKLKDGISGQPAQAEPQLSADEFDPWEAYNDPSSKSYKYREQQTQTQINDAVGQYAQHMDQKMGQQVGMQKLEQELASRGLDAQQRASFMEFASKNPAEYGMDTLINWWQDTLGQGTENQTQTQTGQHSLDGVRNTQNTPSAGGILQGQAPQQSQKSDIDEMWEGIQKAGGRTNVLK